MKIYFNKIIKKNEETTKDDHEETAKYKIIKITVINLTNCFRCLPKIHIKIILKKKSKREQNF